MKIKIYITFIFLLIGTISAAQTDNSQIDDFIENNAFQSFDKISTIIESKFTNDSDRVRAIFSWITENFSYDYELKNSIELQKEFYASKDFLLQKTLERKKAICSGYSLLFKELCDEVGIESVIINGFSKQITDINISKEISDHAWNAVRINGEWYLIDTTWASKSENFGKRGEFWYMTKPEQFIFSHYPENEKWTLLDNNITKDEFDELPIINNRSFFKNNVQILYPKKKVIEVEKDRIININIETEDTDSSIYLLASPQETFASRNNLKFPDNEEYKLLSAKERDKYHLLIPSIEIIDKQIVGNNIKIKAQIVSENIEKFEIIVNGNSLRTVEVILK